MTDMWTPAIALLSLSVLAGCGCEPRCCESKVVPPGHAPRATTPGAVSSSPVSTNSLFLGDWQLAESRPDPESSEKEEDRETLARALEFVKEHGIVFHFKPNGSASLSDKSDKSIQEYTWVIDGSSVLVELVTDNRGPPKRPYKFTLSLDPDGSLKWIEGDGSPLKGAIHKLQRKR